MPMKQINPEREKRLAEALRANLRKRKEAAKPVALPQADSSLNLAARVPKASATGHDRDLEK